ncbi:AMP-dependent synthetase/ligase [Actinomadura parmotrematis]|uniref:Acyl-CoA synthetase n=1 Tax=Actinomadura parmotrematis TaxID=2864039 RepID=A0ABS7FMR0_9ACTN|nr:AMP-dependent synthetase/ligase [Actinomadura parmotrematis]MBW8480867.1 AMP-dependent synthetase/ligase [Actinomadura parmotrematis]
MREFRAPIEAEVPDSANLTDALYGRAAERPGRIALRRRSGRAWAAVTIGEFAAEVTAVARGLVAAGIEPGDRVALMSRTRYEWAVADYAIWAAGGVTVPIYETSSPSQVAWILEDSGASAVIAESPGAVPEGYRVWPVDGAGGLAALAASGADVPDAVMAGRRRSRVASDTATIVYTSGTTGRPKGCELTHANFIGTARNVVLHGVPEIAGPGASTLLFLPLAHVFARLVQVACIECGMVLAHGDVPRLQEDLSTFRPTFLLAVPRVFEKVHNGAAQRADDDGKGRIFALAAGTAVAYSRSLDAGGPSLALRARHRVFDALVYRRLRAALGGRLRYAMSGGAGLNERLGHFFRGIGVQIIEGYGLTETTAPILGNRFADNRMGTVGRVFPGMAVRTAGDGASGEVQVRGVSVFPSYWRNEAATAGAFDGGWFRTGDVGSLDAAGRLTVTGRSKDILVTAGGKNVAPGPLEDLLRVHPLVSQPVVVGDGRPYVAALITLDAEALDAWKARHGKDAAATAAGLRDDPDLRAELDAAVAEANASVSRAEQIKRYRVLDGDFTEGAGHLTPSLKVRRHAVIKDFAAEIDALYS